MTGTDPLWQEIEQHADRLLQLLRDSAPKVELEMPTAHVVIFGIYWRSLRLYDGTLLLLKAELPEEATFLARSLFEESLWLRQLAAEPKHRDALVLNLLNRSINEKRDLFIEAKALGLDQKVGEELASLEEHRRQLHSYRARHRIPKPRKFLPVRDAAIRFDRNDDYWTYELAQKFVHGSDTAWMYARRKTASHSAALYAKTGDAELRAGLAEFAARSLTDAARATCAVFGWNTPSDLGEPVADMRKLLDKRVG